MSLTVCDLQAKPMCGVAWICERGV